MNSNCNKSAEVNGGTPWQETQRLLNEAVIAVIAVNALSNHLEQVPDKPRMYKANQALHVLWGME